MPAAKQLSPLLLLCSGLLARITMRQAHRYTAHLNSVHSSGKRRSRKGRVLTSLRHSTLPATKLCARLPLLFFHSPCTTNFHHSAYTHPLCCPPAHRADSANNVEQVSSPASCHTLQPKAVKQNAVLLGPINCAKRERNSFSLLQDNSYNTPAYNTNSMSGISISKAPFLHVLPSPGRKPCTYWLCPAHISHHLSQAHLRSH